MFFKKSYKKISRKIKILNFNNIKILIKKYYLKLYFIKKFVIIFNTNIQNNIVNVILNNFLKSSNSLYKKTLYIDGVGFKWLLKKKYIYIYVGFSHPKILLIPIDLSININDKHLDMYSFNKQRLGEYSFFIKKIKLPDVYKGKGIKFINEKLLIKNVKKK